MADVKSQNDFLEDDMDGAGQSPDGGHDISRRGVVAGACAIALMVSVGGVGRALAGPDTLLRPPGGWRAADFYGACIRCDRCRSACPQGAIGLAQLEDGLLAARTPRMRFKLGYCNFCADEDGYRCVKACPTQALDASFDPLADKIGMARFDESECVLYRTGAAMCSKQCRDACPYGAIADTSQGWLTIDEQLCNGCGACEFACPSASYASYTGSDRRGINVEVWEG